MRSAAEMSFLELNREHPVYLANLKKHLPSSHHTQKTIDALLTHHTCMKKTYHLLESDHPEQSIEDHIWRLVGIHALQIQRNLLLESQLVKTIRQEIKAGGFKNIDKDCSDLTDDLSHIENSNNICRAWLNVVNKMLKQNQCQLFTDWFKEQEPLAQQINQATNKLNASMQSMYRQSKSKSKTRLPIPKCRDLKVSALGRRLPWL